MTDTTRIAQLTDVHLPIPAGVRGRDLLNKRITGFANWQRGRKNIHQKLVVDRLIADLTTQQPHHIAVTGDLVNLGLPQEFEAARDWLLQVGQPDRVSVIPGNHDTYLDHQVHQSCFSTWHPWMKGNVDLDHIMEFDTALRAGVAFPFVQIVGDVALVALSSAIATPWFNAEGELGDDQIASLSHILQELEEQDKFRLIMVHHPPIRGLEKKRKGLRDADRLEEVLRSHGAELVIYGHNHIQRVDWLEGLRQRIPLVCTPSLSTGRITKVPLGRYNLFDIGRTQSGWRCKVTGRGLQVPDGPVRDLGTQDISPHRHA